MKLNEVVSMFSRFGFTPQEVKSAIGAGDSAHNAFEALKILLEMRWADINAQFGTDKINELRPTYQKLMGLKIKSRTTRADKKVEENNKAKRTIDKVLSRHYAEARQSQMEIVKRAGEILKKKKDRGELSEQEKQNIRDRGFGEFIDGED